MSYGSSGNDLRDIRIDTAHSEHSHGLKKRHKSSAEEHENLFTGPSSSASEVSAGRVSRASKNRKERQKYFDPNRRFLKANSLDREQPNGDEFGDELSFQRYVPNREQNDENQKSHQQAASTSKRDYNGSDSPLSFHGLQNFNKERALEAKQIQADQGPFVDPKMSPYLEQDAKNAQRNSYDLPADKSRLSNDSGSETAKRSWLRLPYIGHRSTGHRKKRHEHDKRDEDDKSRRDSEAQSSDAEFGEDKTTHSEEEARRRTRVTWWNFYKRAYFYRRIVPVIITLGLLIASMVMVIQDKWITIYHFKLFRYGFFLGSLYPIYWVSKLITHLIVLAVESTFFTQRRVMYYLYGVRKPLSRFLRPCMLLGVFIACFYSSQTPDHKARDELHKGYNYCIKIFVCFILFFFAFVLARLMSRAVSIYFHQESYFEKMQSALTKEYFVSTLTTPREQVPKGKALFRDEGGRMTMKATKKNLVSAAKEKYRQVVGNETIAGKVKDKISKDDKEHEPDEGYQGPLYTERRKEEKCKIEAAFTGRGKPRSHVTSDSETDSFDDLGPEDEELRYGAGRQEDSDDLSDMKKKGNRRKNDTHHSGDQAHRRLSRDTHRTQESQLTSQARLSQSRQPTSMLGSTLGSRAQVSTTSSQWWKLKQKREEIFNIKETVDAMGKKRPEGQDGKKEFNHDLVMKLQTAERHLRHNKLKVTFADQIGEAGHEKQDPKKLAFALFFNVKPYEAQRKYLVENDLHAFMPPHKAQKAFNVLDYRQTGQANLRDVRHAVAQIAQERKDLAATLQDSKSIVGKLELLVLIVMHLLLVLVYLVIFQVNINKVWITISSVLLGFSFIFGKVISELFESIIFLFMVKPYDNGDGIFIDMSSGALHTVEEVSLRHCLFMRWDGAKIYYPTASMASQPFVNVSRSSLKWESFILYVDISSPSNTYEELRSAITEHCKTPDADMSGRFACCNYGAGNPMKMKIGIYFEHTTSGTDLGRLDQARHKLFMAICQKLNELGLNYSMPTLAGKHGRGTDPDDGGMEEVEYEQADAQGALETQRPFLGNAEHHMRQRVMAAPNSEVGHPPFMPLVR